ncbi:Macro domain-containing protein [Plasmodiophora brassicae]|uniref:Macro domain-containing protein n=1 Tax=Plasmodiophora brassicae TaxID=37360 RepID=A0A3P3XYQ0_PLABS|nr:unnamed protein product [Plasmodiophora brassicae]
MQSLPSFVIIHAKLITVLALSLIVVGTGIGLTVHFAVNRASPRPHAAKSSSTTSEPENEQLVKALRRPGRSVLLGAGGAAAVGATAAGAYLWHRRTPGSTQPAPATPYWRARRLIIAPVVAATAAAVAKLRSVAKPANKNSHSCSKIGQHARIFDTLVKVPPQCDITKLEVDAIVNAANSELRHGGGVCGAIFEAAGPDALRNACDKLTRPCPAGDVRITPGFNLPAKYVIHAVGPQVENKNPSKSDQQTLRNVYQNALGLAKSKGLRSIAFPTISTGIYGYPKRQAAEVALNAVKDWLEQDDNKGSLDEVILTTFGKDTGTYNELIPKMFAAYQNVQ